MTIRLGYGTEMLAFGLKPDKVKKILGYPDAVVRDEVLETVNYIYYDEDSTFCFDKTDNLSLSRIESSNLSIKLFDVKVMGLGVNSIIDLLQKHDFSQYDLEEYDYWDIVSFEDACISFQIRYGKVSMISWTPFWTDDNTYNWPSD